MYKNVPVSEMYQKQSEKRLRMKGQLYLPISVYWGKIQE